MDSKAPHRSAIYTDEISTCISRKTLFPRECGLMQKQLQEKDQTDLQEMEGEGNAIALNTLVHK